MPIRTERIPPGPYLAVDLVGSGELVLFLHGIGGNRSNWTEQLTAIGGEFLGCAWDARGYGDSDDYEGPLRLADFRNDVLRVLDYFSAQSAHLVGLSMGGFIARISFAVTPRASVLSHLPTHATCSSVSIMRTFFGVAKRPCLRDNCQRDIAPGLAATLTSPQADKKAIQRLQDSISALHKNPTSRRFARRRFAPMIPTSKDLPGSSSLTQSMSRRS